MPTPSRAGSSPYEELDPTSTHRVTAWHGAGEHVMYTRPVMCSSSGTRGVTGFPCLEEKSQQQRLGGEEGHVRRGGGGEGGWLGTAASWDACGGERVEARKQESARGGRQRVPAKPWGRSRSSARDVMQKRQPNPEATDYGDGKKVAPAEGSCFFKRIPSSWPK